jgi:hypothetical protein
MTGQAGRWDRLAQKGLEGQFLWELEHGYELSPRESQGILETVKLLFNEEASFTAGKLSIWVVRREEPAGKPVSELEKIQVLVSLDAGEEDLEVCRHFGQAALRRVRLLRITEEIVEQGGVATEEDLSRLFQVSGRTIRRDSARLRRQGHVVWTRGYYQDIGRGTSHKALIVGRYLKGQTYSEICRQTRHSVKAVRRYLQSFARVAVLLEQKVTDSVSELAFYVGVSERLAGEYIALYNEHVSKASSRARIKELVERVQGGLWMDAPEKGGQRS